MNKAIGLLPFFAQTHAAFLHARGRQGTQALVNLLDCRVGEQVLEIGCGTGATLVLLAALHRKTHFWGVELAPIMYKKAKARLRFCLLDKRVQIKQMEQADRLPFGNDTFDKIYLESVLAIQEDENLKNLLLEIQRILKPGGILVMNETIWLDITPADRIAEINMAVKAAFGIIQANASVPYLKDWINLLHDLGYKILSVEQLRDAPRLRVQAQFEFPYNFLSKMYTNLGKLKLILSVKYSAMQRRNRLEMERIVPAGAVLMGGVLIKAKNEIRPRDQQQLVVG